jgi:RND family efflux transporter MFP subunit
LAKEGVGASGIADDLEARVKSLEQGVTASQASVQAAQAEVNALAAEASTLKVSKGNLTLVAPISGTVMNKPPQLGEYIGPQPPGISVDMGGFELADFSTNVVEADVPEARLHLVKEGGAAEIVLDAYPKKRYRGKVTQITPKVDRAKATVMVRVGFVDDMRGVLPEMSARVSFLAGELDAQAVKEPPKKVLPGNAVAERAGAKVVFVLEGDKVRMVPVELGQSFGGGFVLKQGPAPGTKLVASPPTSLTDGQRIKEKTP